MAKCNCDLNRTLRVVDEEVLYRIGPSTIVEEHLRDSGMAKPARVPKRSGPVQVSEQHVGLGGDEHGDDVHMPGDGCCINGYAPKTAASGHCMQLRTKRVNALKPPRTIGVDERSDAFISRLPQN